VLPTAAVSTLQVGDTVVVDHVTFTADALSCWLGAGVDRRYAGRTTLRQGQLHLVDFATGGKAVMQATAFTQRANGAAGAEIAHDASLGELQVNLRFELARWQAPLAEMATLAAGTVIDLGRRIDEASISIWVEQRCIGHGQLIAVGDRLGVRLLTIFDDRRENAQGNPPPQAESPRADSAAALDAAAARPSAPDASAPEKNG
ncbi:MAG: FliM/FliN family flagellar motor switch protein, partial [Steroidobacteraceae bacterium]